MIPRAKKFIYAQESSYFVLICWLKLAALFQELPQEPNIFEEVKAAYVRKFQQLVEEADEDVDLSENANYKLNNEPFILSREQEPQFSPKTEEQTEQISIPETVSSYTSTKSEIGETISSYQVCTFIL